MDRGDTYAKLRQRFPRMGAGRALRLAGLLATGPYRRQHVALALMADGRHFIQTEGDPRRLRGTPGVERVWTGPELLRELRNVAAVL